MNFKDEVSHALLWVKIQIIFVRNSKKLYEKKINYRLWKKKFLSLWKAKDVRCKELLEEFINCKMEKITYHRIVRKNKYAPILFCVIKNDICKIENFMEHYRKLGIEAFVFLDNNSDDGTKEFLCKQKDAIVYHSSQQYSSVRRVAWLNRLLAIYGHNEWCLIVDSDELVTYIGAEKYQFSDIIKKASENHYYRVEGFLLDMYSNNDIFQEKIEGNYIQNCKYFDTNSYNLHVAERRVVITQGPRKRIFNADVCLTKYPLFFYRDNDFVASSHHIIPYEPFRKCPVWFAICHYKFIDDKDLIKIKEAVREENYSGGSCEYKKYLSTISLNNKINFYNEETSCEMKDSYSLKNISFLRSPFQ